MTEQRVLNDVWYKCTRKRLYGVCEPGMGAVSLTPVRVCQEYQMNGDLMCTLRQGHDGPHHDENALEMRENPGWI
jgi:hypothetical protein